MSFQRVVRSPIFFRWVAALLVLALGLILTQRFVVAERSTQEADSQAAVQEFGQQFTDRVNNSLLPAYYLTHSIESYIESVDGVLQPSEFSDLLDRIYSHSTNIRNIAIAPNNRITYVSPLKGNESALGVYYPDLPAQWPAIQSVIKSKLPQLVGPVDLVQGGRGMIYRYPVFKTNGDYWGMVSTVIDIDSFLEEQAAIPLHNQVTFGLRSVNANGTPGAIFWGDPKAFDNPDATFMITPLEASWQLAVTGPPIDQKPLNLISTLGFALSLLIAWLVFQLIRAIQRRRVLNERLAAVSAQIPGVLFEFQKTPHGNGHFLYVSAGCEPLFDISSDELLTDPQLLINQIHPDDRETIASIFNEYTPEAPSRRETFRVSHADGSQHWILGEAVSSFNTDGTILWRGSFNDVSNELRAAEQLKISASVFGATHDAVMILDPAGIVIDINPGFTTLLGYERDEVLGHHANQTATEAGQEALFVDIRRYLTRHDFWRGEVVYRRKNGQVGPEAETLTAVRDESGNLIYYVAVVSSVNSMREDFVTGLPNRNLLDNDLQQQCTTAAANQLKVAFLAIGLDGFRAVNDAYGHRIGDLLLHAVAERLSLLAKDGNNVYRLHGDEFAVIHPELGSGVNLDGLCSQILNTLAQPFTVGTETIHISAGIGIALFPDDSVSPLELSQMASFALRSAKVRGAGQISYFHPAMQEEAAERLQLIEDMHQALAAKEFQVYYQPIVNLADNTVVKAEALTRWNHATRGAVSPGVFIPSAERSGLISQLGEFVTAQSVEFAQQMRQEAPEFEVSFNMSPMELSEESTHHTSRIELIRNSALPGSAFVIEITEGLLLNADATVRANLDAYHEAGFSFAIDDFGTGYSSLAYLQSLDVDWIKIDQSFVQRLDEDSDSFVLVQAMIVMAHQLGLQVIAEGVETEKQRDLLKEAKCDFAQGFLYSPAIPPQEFRLWRETWSAQIQ